MPRKGYEFNPYQLAFRLVVAGAQWHGDTISRKWCQILYLPQEVEVESVNAVEAIYAELNNWPDDCYKLDDRQICIPFEPLSLIGP